MSTATVNTRSETPRRELPWRRRGEAGFDKPTLPVLSVVICCYFSVSLSLLAPSCGNFQPPSKGLGMIFMRSLPA